MFGFLTLGEKLQLKGLMKQRIAEEAKLDLNEKEINIVGKATDKEDDDILDTEVEDEEVLEDTKVEVEYKEDDSNDLLVKKSETDWKDKIGALIGKMGDSWRCRECGKMADNSKDRWRLKVHVEIHLAGVVHTCTMCGHKSTTSAALGQHKYKNHKDEMQTMKSAALKYNCNICGKGSRTRKGLVNHTYKRLKSSSRMSNAGYRKKLFQCKLCGKGSITSKSLQGHMYKWHRGIPKVEGKYKCGVCGKGSKTAKGRQLHKYKYHKNKQISEEPVVDGPLTESNEEDCVNIKEDSYVTKKDALIKEIGVQIEKVKREVQILHEQSKERTLDKETDAENGPEDILEKEVDDSVIDEGNISGDTSMVEDLAEVHQKSMSVCAREGEMWTCTKCGKKAEDKHKHNLFRHAEVHLEGLAFPCDECGKVSRSSHGLYQHKAKVHPKDRVESQYKCAVCGKGSKTFKGLESHRYKYHKAGVKTQK